MRPLVLTASMTKNLTKHFCCTVGQVCRDKIWQQNDRGNVTRPKRRSECWEMQEILCKKPTMSNECNLNSFPKYSNQCSRWEDCFDERDRVLQSALEMDSPKSWKTWNFSDTSVKKVFECFLNTNWTITSEVSFSSDGSMCLHINNYRTVPR